MWFAHPALAPGAALLDVKAHIARTSRANHG
jgi:hypothetical protein